MTSHSQAYQCMTSGTLLMNQNRFAQAVKKYEEAATHFKSLASVQSSELIAAKYASEANTAAQLAAVLRHSQSLSDGPVQDLLKEAAAEADSALYDGPNAILTHMDALARQNVELQRQVAELRQTVNGLRQGLDLALKGAKPMEKSPTQEYDRAALAKLALESVNPALLAQRCQIASLLHEQGLLHRLAHAKQEATPVNSPAQSIQAQQQQQQQQQQQLQQQHISQPDSDSNTVAPALTTAMPQTVDTAASQSHTHPDTQDADNVDDMVDKLERSVQQRRDREWNELIHTSQSSVRASMTASQSVYTPDMF